MKDDIFDYFAEVVLEHVGRVSIMKKLYFL